MGKFRYKITLILIFLYFYSGFSQELLKSYQAASSAFRSRQYASARLLFEEILEKEPASQYASSAQYYIALSYYMENLYENAQVEFQKMVEQYSSSRHAPSALFFIGECEYYRKNYPKSITIHEQFSTEYPDHKFAPRALYTIGYIYMLQERFQESAAVFARALEKYPQHSMAPEIHLKLGEAYYNNREYSKARLVFSKIILKSPIDLYSKSNLVDDAQFWIAKSYFAQKNYDEARKQFGYVLDKFPKGDVAPNSLYFISLAYVEEKRYFEAIENFQRLREKYPKHVLVPASLYREAQIQITRDKINDAVIQLEQLIRSHADSKWFGPAIFQLGELYIRQNKEERALKLYAIVSRKKGLEPAIQSEAWLKLGHIQFNRKNFDDALNAYMTVLDDYPETTQAPEALTFAVKVNVQLNRSGMAMKLLDRGLDRYANTKEKNNFLLLKADIHYRNTDYNQSLKFYQALLKSADSSRKKFDARMGIAYSYFEQKQYPRAADGFREILQAAEFKKIKNRDEAVLGLGAAQYNMRQFKKAIATLESVALAGQQSPVKSKALYELAWTHFRLDDFDQSRRYFLQYVKKYTLKPRSVAAQYFLGWTHLKQGEGQKSQQYFQKVILFQMPQTIDADTKNFFLKQLNEYQPLAWFYSGKSYLNEGNHKKAGRHFSRMALMYPQHELSDDALYELCLMYMRDGDEANWKKYLATLESRYPDSPFLAEFYFALAGHMKVKGNDAAALAYYQKVNTTYQNSHLAHNALYETAVTRYQGKAYQQALADFRQYLARFPNKSLVDDVYLYIGRTHEKMGHGSMALKSWEKAFRNMVPERRFEARMEIADFHYRNGEYKKAKDELVHLVKKKGMGGQGYYLLALIAEKEGKPVSAVDNFRLSARKGNGEYAARSELQIGRYYISRQKYKTASKSFIRLVHSYSQFDFLVPEAYYSLVVCFQQMNSPKEARRYFQRLQKEYPDSPWRSKAAGLNP